MVAFAFGYTGPSVLVLMSLGLAFVQGAHSHVAPPSSAAILEVAQRPVTLQSGIGTAHDPVGTASKEAQAFASIRTWRWRMRSCGSRTRS
jgi:hypothetical protein